MNRSLGVRFAQLLPSAGLISRHQQLGREGLRRVQSVMVDHSSGGPGSKEVVARYKEVKIRVLATLVPELSHGDPANY